MHIQDFYSKLISGTEEGKLFQALRNLSLLEDVRVLLNESNWPDWSAAASAAAQA